MKRRNSSAKNLKIKTVLLAAVSLILVALMAVTATASWIEDVSQVEFKTNDDSQETPVHIGDNILKADAVMKSNPSGSTEVNLGDYFNKSGDMHLSPCYGDGENFYFPVVSGTNGATGYRTGTKDDANVNYLSATFRIVSEGASTAYWFEKSGANHDTPYVTFKDGGANGDAVSGLEQYLRCSVTIDGATSVYALNSNGKFYTLVSDTPTQQNGKRIDQYTYYTEQFNSSTKLPTSANSSLANQGTGDNLNGNTLFTVNQYNSENKNTVKTVTLKIWLEYSSATGTSDADLASLNLNFVSSWAKTRRIFVRDKTVDEWDSGIGHTGTKWLGNSNAKLYWSVNNGETHFAAMTETSTGSGVYYIYLPAVYNNVKTTLYRCNGNWNVGNNHPGEPVPNYWDKWETTFPNTFHSEYYSIYSHKYATWDREEAKYVTFVDSAKFLDQGLTPKVYLWDSASVYASGVNDKVVKNADWPGLEMTRMYETTGSSKKNLATYRLFFGSTYDRAVFNDGRGGNRNELQTQDLFLKSGNSNWYGKYFDMATLGWYNSISNLPTYSDCVLVNNFNTNGSTQAHIRMVRVNSNNDHYLMCKAFIKSPGDYFFKIYDGSTHWGRPQNWDTWAEGWDGGSDSTLRNIYNSNADGDLIWINVTESDISGSGRNGVMRFYFDKDSHWFKWEHGEN